MRKYNNFAIDIETTSSYSDAGILSIGIVPFDLDETPTIEELRERSLFYKFDIRDQIKKYNVHLEEDTMEWWKQQSQEAKERSILPNAELDVKIDEVWQDIVKWVRDRTANNFSQMLWSRGAFEQPILQLMNRKLGYPKTQRIDGGWFNKWNDFRSVLRTLHNSDYDRIHSKIGKIVVDYPEWEMEAGLMKKHDPISDCIIDIIMLLYGTSE